MKSYPKMLWLLAVGCFLNISALSFLWPLNSIYIHEHLGKPLAVAGLVLLLNSAGATAGQLIGGMLYDRIGARPVLLSGLIASSALIALPGLFHNWPMYVAVMLLFGFTGSLPMPTMNALATKTWPEGGRRAFNFLYVANNLGVAAGTAVGGVVAQHSFEAAFLSASITLLLFATFVFFFIRDRKPRDPDQALAQTAATQETAATSSLGKEPIAWLPILSLFVACFLLWIVYVQWQGAVAVHMLSLGIPLSKYSVLWTINGVVIFIGQPVIARLVKVLKSYAAQMTLGAILYVVVYVLLYSAHGHYSLFVIAMIMLTFGEMLLWPVIPAAVAQLSPPSRTGFLQGFIGMATTIGRMLGPLTGGLLFDHTSFQTLLIVMLVSLVIPLLLIRLYARTSLQRSVPRS